MLSDVSPVFLGFFASDCVKLSASLTANRSGLEARSPNEASGSVLTEAFVEMTNSRRRRGCTLLTAVL